MGTLAVMPSGDPSSAVVLLGNLYGIPFYEARYGKSDVLAKDEKSHCRLRIVLGGAFALAVLAGGFRMVRSIQVSRNFGYMRKRILNHPSVLALVGPNARIQKSEGHFGG